MSDPTYVIDGTISNYFGFTLAAGGSLGTPLTVTTAGAVEGGNAGIVTTIPATIQNYGTIAATANFGIGIDLRAEGSVTNGSTGTITSVREGFNGDAGQIDNFGFIGGVGLLHAGSLTNQSTGTIGGVSMLGGSTLDNFGTIEVVGGYGVGVTFFDSTLLNESGGSIGGAYIGVEGLLANNTTFENAGTISGGAYAVKMEGFFTDRLIVDGGAVFDGDVVATATAANTLELSARTGPGTISGIGSQFQDFQTVTIDAGAQWDIGTIAAATLVKNAGTVGANSGAGIAMAGGSVSNQATGTIMGADMGVALTQQGTVRNFGSIGATGTGVYMAGGGIVRNEAGATISGADAGVDFAQFGTISNYGGITASGVGIELSAGGKLGNSGRIVGGSVGVLLDGAASITNYFGDGIAIAIFGDAFGIHATADGEKIVNGGTISASSGAGIGLEGADSVTNTHPGTIVGGEFGIHATADGTTIYNAGSIFASSGTGIDLEGTGSVTNVSNGRITGGTFGIRAAGDSATIINYGSVGGASGTGIDLEGSGSITNVAGGHITGGTFGIQATEDGVTIVNSGVIDGGSGTGVNLEAGGGLRNLSTGTITGYAYGVVAYGTSATLENAGTIGGGYTAVYLGASGANRLIVDVGAVFNGDVVANQTAANVIELTSGASDGTLAGLDVRYFQTLTIDSGARWEIGTVTGLDRVVNAGTVGLESYNGVELASGSVVNLAGATIVATGRYGFGVHVTDDTGTVDNSGYIGAAGRFGYAVKLEYGGSVTNAAGGRLIGYYGVSITGDAAFVSNAGYIAVSAEGVGVRLSASDDTLINTGTIFGDTGAELFGDDHAFLYNSGTIDQGSEGILVQATDVTVINTGTIAGIGRGAALAGDSVTLENAGTISVSNHGVYNYAVGMGGYSNRLIIDPGAVFDGQVQADRNASNTIELKSGAAAGTVSGLGVQYLHFQTVTIDSGAAWTIGGAEAGFNGTTIEGFDFNDRLDLTNLSFDAGDTIDIDDVTDVLTIRGVGGNVLDTIHLTGDFGGDFFHLANDHKGGSYITENEVPCFCRGTMIRTAEGDIAVENLRIGHYILTVEGGAVPLKWIGRRSYRDWLAIGNPEVQPICFKAGSIADQVPERDLYVSPEHAMFLDGVLIPARHLVNGASILKMEELSEIDYFHLEFDRHVVIFAEGAAAESFVDDDSRTLFHNADEYRRLYPDEPHCLHAEFYAPRVEDGGPLDALHRALSTRAAHLRPGGAAAPWGRRANVEVATRTLVAGWAFSGVDAGPVALAILVNGALVGRIVADRHRADLEEAGIGDGCYGFRFRLPKGLAADTGHTIEVRREIDWTLLHGGCVTLAPGRKAASRFDGDGANNLGQLATA